MEEFNKVEGQWVWNDFQTASMSFLLQQLSIWFISEKKDGSLKASKPSYMDLQEHIPRIF